MYYPTDGLINANETLRRVIKFITLEISYT
jgi:hypothetical protein